jgi:16S rRNA processing protein RimM
MGKSGFLLIGKVLGLHGLQGNLRVYSYAESAGTFKAGAALLVRGPGPGESSFKIQWARPHKKGVLLSLEGVDLNRAEGLVGAELLMDKAELDAPEEGTWFWDDLIGLTVMAKDGTRIGRLDSIIATGSNDVYVVKEGTGEVLVPALESVVLSVDLDKGEMVVDLPEGL